MTDSDPELLPAPVSSSLNASTDSLNDLPTVTDRSLRRCASESSLERELASLHREMETIRLECDKLILKHSDNERSSVALACFFFFKSTLICGGSFDSANIFINVAQTTLNDQKCELSDEVSDAKCRLEDTSSAYNTGESCRSTPLKSDFQIKKNNRCMKRYPAVLEGPIGHITRCIDSQKPTTSQIPKLGKLFGRKKNYTSHESFAVLCDTCMKMIMPAKNDAYNEDLK
ncbi:unnamed protein product [Gongylonema pulchrum]|uniref:Uncharacterized protein n=1 Tax=Gongylonema pulchrum TaxID=637853 RepID=A0A183CWM1_9BILA|nr:unnamed protein product [Gongylonema pulchrum]